MFMNFNPVSVVPFRKDHLETCIHSTLSTRSGDPIDFGASKVALPDMDDSDVYLRLVGLMMACEKMRNSLHLIIIELSD